MGLETKKPPMEVGPAPGSAGGSPWVALASSSPGSTPGAGAVVGPQGLIQPAEMSGEKVVSVGKAARPACGVGSLRKKKTTTKQQPQNTSLLASQAQAIRERGWAVINSGAVRQFRQVSVRWDEGSCWSEGPAGQHQYLSHFICQEALSLASPAQTKTSKNTGQRKPKKPPPRGFVTEKMTFSCFSF